MQGISCWVSQSFFAWDAKVTYVQTCPIGIFPSLVLIHSSHKWLKTRLAGKLYIPGWKYCFSCLFRWDYWNHYRFPKYLRSEQHLPMFTPPSAWKNRSMTQPYLMQKKNTMVIQTWHPQFGRNPHMFLLICSINGLKIMGTRVCPCKSRFCRLLSLIGQSLTVYIRAHQFIGEIPVLDVLNCFNLNISPFWMIKPAFSSPCCHWYSCNAPAGTGRRLASAGTSRWRCLPGTGAWNRDSLEHDIPRM